MTTATASEAFIPVSIATLSITKVADFRLFIRRRTDEPFQLYRDRDYPIQSSDLEKLFNEGVKSLYVTLDDHERYQQYLRENFVAVLNDERLPGSERCDCLNEVVRCTLAEAFASGDQDHTVATAKDLAFQTVDMISRGDVTASELLNVMDHDYHTFTHSANVSYYCVLLAKELGISSPSELSEIATGAILHDLGKLSIPEAILKKPGKLEDKEFAKIKRHPTEGFLLLAKRDDLNFAQLMMVYQHHERMDGGGYPVGVAAADIHPWAQICAVADIYEALTSNRPYRPGIPTETAIEIIDRAAGAHVNQEMWECWKTIIRES